MQGALIFTTTDQEGSRQLHKSFLNLFHIQVSALFIRDGFNIAEKEPLKACGERFLECFRFFILPVWDNFEISFHIGFMLLEHFLVRLCQHAPHRLFLHATLWSFIIEYIRHEFFLWGNSKSTISEHISKADWNHPKKKEIEKQFAKELQEKLYVIRKLRQSI